MTLRFQVTARDDSSAARCGRLETRRGSVATPLFMAVGTRASVTGLGPQELRQVGTEVVLGNTYHLMLRPGPDTFERVGGIHRFMAWDGPVLTDSGGYQIFSLADDCEISEQGARFRAYTDQRFHLLSPERSVEMQTAIGSDIMMVLDECVDSRSEPERVRAAMERTHRWALRSLAARQNHEQALFAIVQGGIVPELRRESADFLCAQPFEGFAMGGLAVGDSRSQREEITQLAAELLPANRPRYLMGVGTPPDLLVAIGAGLDMFDCMLPTYMARQGYAFTATGRVRLTRMAAQTADIPLDATCSCSTCRTFSRSYLHHLFKSSEPLGPRLVAVHNLSHYNDLLAQAQAAIQAGHYRAFAKRKLAEIDRHEHAS